MGSRDGVKPGSRVLDGVGVISLVPVSLVVDGGCGGELGLGGGDGGSLSLGVESSGGAAVRVTTGGVRRLHRERMVKDCGVVRGLPGKT